MKSIILSIAQLPLSARRLLLAVLFLLLCLPTGLMLAGTVPLGQVPDELPHIAKADSLLHEEWIGHREVKALSPGQHRVEEGVTADPDLLATTSSALRIGDITPEHLDLASLRQSEGRRFQEPPRFLEIGTIAGYFPLFYVPGATSLLAAKLTGKTPFFAFLLVRIVNLCVALLLGAMAVFLATRGAVLLFVVLALPTSLSLAASANQDGLLIPATALAVALVTRFRTDRAIIGDPCFWSAAGLLCGIALAKPPYVPLTLLLLLPLRPDQGKPIISDFVVRAATIVAIVGLVVGWMLVVVHQCATPVDRPPAEAGPLWQGTRPAVFHGTDFRGQLAVLRARPWLVLSLPLHSMIAHSEVFFQTVGLLGWLNFVVPSPVWALWVIALGFAGAATMIDKDAFRGNSILEAILLFSTVAVIVVLIYASQYLSFTQVGSETVEGVQGRYFLPLLLVLAVALPTVANGRRFVVLAVFPATVAACATFFWLPRAAAAFYYGG